MVISEKIPDGKVGALSPFYLARLTSPAPEKSVPELAPWAAAASSHNPETHTFHPATVQSKTAQRKPVERILALCTGPSPAESRVGRCRPRQHYKRPGRHARLRRLYRLHHHRPRYQD